MINIFIAQIGHISSALSLQAFGCRTPAQSNTGFSQTAPFNCVSHPSLQKDSRFLLTYIAWAYSSAQISSKIRRDGKTNSMWQFVLIFHIKHIFPPMPTSLWIQNKHSIQHGSLREPSAVWQTDTQTQWFIHTTIDPPSLGCLDKLTPSHWLSRSSRQVFPQRSPLSWPRRQRPMLWTEGGGEEQCGG